MAKMTILPHLPRRDLVKVADTDKFGKSGENDNFATLANKAKHKAMRGPIKVGDTGEFGKYGENDNFATIANRALRDSKNYVELTYVSLQGVTFSKPHRKYFLVE